MNLPNDRTILVLGRKKKKFNLIQYGRKPKNRSIHQGSCRSICVKAAW